MFFCHTQMSLSNFQRSDVMTLVHRILNDLFREKVACLRSGRRLTRLRQSTVSNTIMWGSMMRLAGCAHETWLYFVLVLAMRAKTEREKGNWLTCGREIPWFYGDGSWESYGLKSSGYGNSVLSRTRRKSNIGFLISAPNHCNQWIRGCFVFIIKAFKFTYFCTWKQVF